MCKSRRSRRSDCNFPMQVWQSWEAVRSVKLAKRFCHGIRCVRIYSWRNVPRPKTLAVIARADLLLRTTVYDGDAISVREGLAIGTRVLATDNGMRPDGVFLFHPLTPAALSIAVASALAAPTTKARQLITFLSIRWKP